MASDPAFFLIFSVVIVAVNTVILLLLKETGRPVALMISSAAVIFFAQQVFAAYLHQQIETLVQALGAGAFFSIFLSHLIHQTLTVPKEPAKPGIR